MKLKKLTACLFSLGIAFSLAGGYQQAFAAKKPHLNKQTVYLKPKKAYRLKLLNNKKKVKWQSSNTKVAKVNKKGEVKALKGGKCKIRAIVGKKAYAATVDVGAIGLNASYEVFIGKTMTLHLNGTMDTPAWSIADPQIATIDADGNVKGISAGTTSVNANYNGVDYTAALNVYATPKLNKKKLTLGDGETYQLILKNNKSHLTLKWKSSNKKAATVKNGLVKAKKKGKTTIMASYGSLKLKCQLTVTNKVRINQKNVVLVPKEKKTFTLRHYKDLLKKEKNNKNKKTKKNKKQKNLAIKWSTSNKKIATINKKGKLTAKNKAGSVKVIAKVGKRKYSIKMKVIKPKIVAEDAYKVDGQYQLTLDQMSRTPIWTSDNEQVAKISDNGLLTPVSYGTVNITATINKYKVTKTIQIIGRYHVNFDKNGDAIGDIAGMDAYENDTITLPAGFTKPGYDQVSWNTNPDGTGTSYGLNAAVSGLAHTGKITLYAIYQKKAEYANIPVERAIAIVGMTGNPGSSSGGSFKAANNRMASIDYVIPSQTMYFSIDDFVDYQIDFAKYNMDGTYVTKNGWRSHGLIMEAGYKYRMSFRKPDDSDFTQADIATVSNLIRYEVPDANKLGIVKTPQGTVHRGINDDKTYPENSLPAFENVVAKMPNKSYIETDIHSTADGNFAVIHDKTMGRTTAKIERDASGNITGYVYDNTPVKNLTMQEIKDNYVLRDANGDIYQDKNGNTVTVPSLDEYLCVCHDGGKKAFLEIKEITKPAYYQTLINTINSHMDKNDIVLSSFNVGYLENIKNTIPEASGIGVYPLLHDTLDDDELTLLDAFNYSAINSEDDRTQPDLD